LFQTQRSLADINAIMGKTGAQTSELGRLQRAQIQDQRELTKIQLARSQRELNMQLALSRLRAPGETAAERAVRRREAEMQAKEQQRELDINRRSSGRGFEIQDIGFGRQARDLAKQLDLIQSARVVSVEVRGIGKAIEAKQALLGVKQSMLGVSQSVGTEVKKAGWSIIQSLESRLGTFNKQTIKQIDAWLTGWQKEWADFQASIDTTPRTKGGSRTGGNRPTASGGIFNVLGATSFTAGEAGNEQVVVLRNPRSGSMPAMSNGSAGSPVNIHLTLNAKVSNEGDEDRLARKVARMLHQEASLLVGG